MNQQRQIQFGNIAACRMLAASEVGYPATEEFLKETLRTFNFRDVVIVLARINLLIQRSDDLFECERILQQNFCNPILQNAISSSRTLKDSFACCTRLSTLLTQILYVPRTLKKRQGTTWRNATSLLTNCLRRKLLLLEWTQRRN